MGCTIRSFIANSGPDKMRDAMNNIDERFGEGYKGDYYKEFFSGFANAMFQMKGASYIKESLNIDEIPKDMDTFVRDNVGYPSIKELLSEKNTTTRDAALGQLHKATEYYTNALAANNFKKDNHAFQEMQGAYINAYKNMDNMIKRGEVAGAMLSGDLLSKKGNMLLGNYAKAWEKHPEIYRLEYDQGNLYTYARNYFTTAEKAFTQVFTRNLKGDTKLSFKMAQNLLKYMDEQYESLDFNDKLASYGFKTPEDIADATARMETINKEWQVLNYGDTLENIKADGGKYDPTDEKYSYKHNKIEYMEDGKPDKIDSYLFAITKMGKNMVALIQDRNRTSDVHDSEKKLLNWFGENKAFQPRMNNYVPSESDDMVSKIFAGGNFSGLFRDATFLQHLKSGAQPAEDSLAINSFVTNNQVFQHMVEKMSSFSTQKAKLDALAFNNAAFGRTSPQAYKLIKNETERRIAKFDKKWDKGDEDPMTALTRSTKKLASSYNSFIGTSILNLSAPVNYIAGLTSAGTRLGIAGIKDHASYLGTLNKSSWEGDVARQIRDYMKYESPISGKTDELVRPEINFKNGRTWLTNALELLSHGMDKVSTFNVERGFWGLIPGMKWLAFNNSENFLTRVNESLLFKDVESYLKGGLKSGEITEANMKEETGKAIEKFKLVTYMKSKQAIGYFDSKTKPFWTHEIMSDAESGAKVLQGAFLQQLYMFKHVEWLNSDLLNRSIAALPVMNYDQLKANVLVGGAAASPMFASALMGMATYDILTDETTNEMTGWDLNKPMKSSLLSNIAPTNMATDIALTAGSLFYNTVLAPTFNLPISESAVKQVKNFGIGLAGVWFSRQGRYGDILDEAYDGRMVAVASKLLPDLDILDKFDNIGDISKNTWEMNKELKATMRDNTKVPIFGFPLSQSNDWLKLLADGGTALHGVVRAFKSGKGADVKDAGKFMSKTLSNMIVGSIWYPKNANDTNEWNNRNFDYDIAYNSWGDYKYKSKEWTAFDSFLRSMKNGKFYGFAYHNQNKMLRSNTAFYKGQ